jgi:hypothetical protein
VRDALQEYDAWTGPAGYGAYADKGLAFIYDPDQAYIGVIKGDYFYRRQLTTGKEEMVSVVGNECPLRLRRWRVR